jgi:hypothetical protein
MNLGSRHYNPTTTKKKKKKKEAAPQTNAVLN